MTPQRHECLIQYGRTCRCCGEQRIHLLEIDHLVGGRGEGNTHRHAIYPRKIEDVLAALDYPAQVDGHVIHILCAPCHRSKGKYGSCMIDHTRAAEDEAMLDDSPHDASTNGKGKKGRVTRELATTVQFSARISPELKERLDWWTNSGELTYAQVLKKLLERVDADGHEQYGELIGLLHMLLDGQRSIVEMLSNLTLPPCDPDSSVKEMRVEHDFPHAVLSPQPAPRPLPAPSVISQVESPSRWRRAWWRLWR